MGFARWMSQMIPDAKIRWLVASWPTDAPRGAVTAFCHEHGVSRSWFYQVRAAAVANGAWGAMELASTRPHVSPGRVDAQLVQWVLLVRSQLQEAGFDFGPLSVQAKLRRMGLDSPSRATIARIFNRAGVVRPEPKKKPRSAFRRFVYPAPNCCWQIDSTEWSLVNGRKVVIFQLIDDHSRLALASLVAVDETSEAAIRVVDTAISRHGVPQKFLSDNGAALNPTRRGQVGLLVLHLRRLGVIPMTGKPGRPTTQGKNERSHRTLHRFLNARPPAESMDELQELVDEFDDYYNTEREHQGLPGQMTPREAWDMTPVATAPAPPSPLENQHARATVASDGLVRFNHTRYKIGIPHAGHRVEIIHNEATVTFFDSHGTEILSHLTPPPGTAYVGNGLRKGWTPRPSTKS